MSSKIRVVCPGCSLLCNDILLEINGNKIEHVYNACSRGNKHFLSHISENRIKEPSIREGGELRTVTIEDALNKTVDYLKNAKRPLLYGWISTSCEAQKLGISIARKIGGIIDTPGSLCHVPSLIFLEDHEIRMLTFKEVRDLADFIIFWGCNPSSSHLRLFSKYAVLARGRNTEKGKEDRYVCLVDIRQTETRSISDLFLKIIPEQDHVLLKALVDGLRGNQVFNDAAGVSQKDIRELVSNMKQARFGVIFFGLGFIMGKMASENFKLLNDLFVELKKLDLNFAAMPMSGHYNMVGFKKVLQDNSNYKINADFKNEATLSTEDLQFHNLLNSNTCDVILIVGANPLSTLPYSRAKLLKDKKVILIDPFKNLTAEVADLIIPTTLTGVESEGTAYRTDQTEVKLIKSVTPTANQMPLEQLLSKILKKI